MHELVTDAEHTTTAQACPCEYGITVRGLKIMRREAYSAVQNTKKAVAK